LSSYNVATNYIGTVVLSSSDVQAVLPAAYSFTAANSGAHTFSATLKTAGPQTMTARDSAKAISGTSAAIQVAPVGERSRGDLADQVGRE